MNNFSSAAARREEIVRLVRGRAVKSQGELGRALAERGLLVAQATLSRDIRELGLAKGPAGYLAPPDGPAPAASNPPAAGRLARAVRDFVLSVEPAGAIVVLKTPPAAAQAVARAIDQAAVGGVVGTIAGDDTVFMAARSPRAAAEARRRFLAVLGPPRARRKGP